MSNILKSQSPCIAFLSTYGKGISLTKVVKNISAGIKSKKRTFLYALDLEGKGIREEDGLYIVPSFCDGKERTKAAYIERLIGYTQPELVFVLLDIFSIGFHIDYLLAFKKKGIKLIAFVPIDGELVNIQPIIGLADFDHLVFYTHFTKEKFTHLYQKSVSRDKPITLPCSSSVIPHGVNVQHFYPITTVTDIASDMERRRRAKMLAFPNRKELHESIIILNANRNWSRKRLDITLEGFAYLLQKSKKKTYLYLHLPSAPEEEVLALRSLAQQLEITDRVIMPNKHQLVSIEQLNLIYNACEIGVNTAMGEGWGLVSCEHAVTGAAQILPGHTHFRELWEESVAYLKTKQTVADQWHDFIHLHVPSAESLGQQLKALIDNPEFLHLMSQKAKARIFEKHLSWNEVSGLWETLFQKYLQKEALA